MDLCCGLFFFLRAARSFYNAPKNKLEEWYDELYQMMLLAMLELEQVERNQKINELKTHF